MAVRKNTITTGEANKLKIFRKKLKISQTKMAEDTGKPQSTIARYETGGYIIPSEFIDTLVKVYKMNTDWFYNDNGNHTISIDNQLKKKDLITLTSTLRDEYTLLKAQVDNLKREFKKIHTEFHAIKQTIGSNR